MTMFRTLLAFLLFAGIASAQDSPLVALAKHSNRSTSKRPVITNDTLATLKGRISFTAGETPSGPVPTYVPAPPTPAPHAAPTTSPAPAVTAEDYSLPSTARNIAPQTSASTTAPQSTARTIEPVSGARNV